MYASDNSNKMSNPKDAMTNEGGNAGYPSCNIMHASYKSMYGAKQGPKNMIMSACCSMRKIASSLGRDASEASQVIIARIRHRPVQSSLIAISLGVVMGMLARR